MSASLNRIWRGAYRPVVAPAGIIGCWSRVKSRLTVGSNAFTVPPRLGPSAAYGGYFMSTRSIALNSRRLPSCHNWPKAGGAMRGGDWKPDGLKTGHRGWPATHAPTDL